MSDPRVSVIVPIYNADPYLDECLDSIENQTEQSLEIICVNDKSTDRTAEILESRNQTLGTRFFKGRVLVREPPETLV